MPKEKRATPASIERAKKALLDLVEGKIPSPKVFSEGCRYFVVFPSRGGSNPHSSDVG